MANFLKPVAVRTFEDYAVKVFFPYVNAKLWQVSRLDIVWDQCANKTDLFTFLVNYIKLQTTSKQLVSTNGSEVVCIPTIDNTHLAPCNHEEADTRMILHIADAVDKGFQKILLRTVDSDVVVLCVAVVAKISVRELWIAFGTGKHFRYIAAHEIAASLGPNKSQALPMFHAYTGCDTVSSFATRGKKTAWDTWKA